MLHQVQAEGRVVAQHVVDVEGGAAGLVGTVGEAGVVEVVLLGGLADQVQAATGGAGAGEGRARALAHFDLLDVEHFAGLRGDVAHAVEEGVALGVEAADERTVTRRVATLAGAEGDAGRGAQGIGQGQGTGIPDHLLRDHGDGLGRLQQRRGVFLRGRLLDVVGLFLLLANDGVGVEIQYVLGGFLFRRLGCQGEMAAGHGGDRHADGGSQQTR
ncbi:hypothetical protein D3C76_990260 [compost metagenome]